MAANQLSVCCCLCLVCAALLFLVSSSHSHPLLQAPKPANVNLGRTETCENLFFLELVLDEMKLLPGSVEAKLRVHDRAFATVEPGKTFVKRIFLGEPVVRDSLLGKQNGSARGDREKEGGEEMDVCASRVESRSSTDTETTGDISVVLAFDQAQTVSRVSYI